MRCLAIACSITLWSAIAWGQDPLLVEAKGSLLAVDSITPGGEVAWMSVIHDKTDPRFFRIFTYEGTAVDDDGDGAVEVELERPLGLVRSAVVVEIASGRSGVLEPDLPERRKRPIKSRVASANAAIEVEGRAQLELLVVRPGVGHWRGSLVRAGAEDQEKGRGTAMRHELAGFALGKVGGPSAPATFRGADVLAGIDPLTLDILETELVQ